jgi:DNA-directed RNA polymerase subunit beta'
MVLGLYYVTKGRKGTADNPVIGEGRSYYSAEEVIIAINEKKLSKHANIKVRAKVRNEKNELVTKLIDTVAGRVIFNQFVPEEVGFINELLTKKKLQQIIAMVFKISGMARCAQFLDDIKELGFQSAYKGGLSIVLNDVMVPEAKSPLIEGAKTEVDNVWNNYLMGLITDNERYNQVIDI